MGRKKGRRRQGGGDGSGNSNGDGGVRQRVEVAGRRVAAEPTLAHDLPWAPPFRSMLTFALCMRLWGATIAPVTDCDEVYNYWEPTHMLMYGRGMQTWEYSPEYGLRSYAYVGLHALAAQAMALVNFGDQDKVAVFFGLRWLMAALSAFTEASLYETLMYRVNRMTAVLSIVFLVVSAGMFHAAHAFLPSAFAMNLVMWAYIFWLNDHVSLTMLAGCLAVLLGWPFSGLVFVPVGLHMLATGHARKVIVWGLLWSALVVAVCAYVDRAFYGKWVIAVWNIVKYNALGGGGGDGSELYGVEPPAFYFKNLFLNFNVMLPLALLSFVATLLPTYIRRGAVLTLIAPVFLWLGFMTSRAHKEERFMFVIYPLLCVAAALTVSQARVWMRMLEAKACGVRGNSVWRLSNVATYAVVATTLLLSLSRILALHMYYSAPLHTFQHFSQRVAPKFSGDTATLCMGKEWYRFPSAFFLPDEPTRVELAFLKSQFSGQLPQPYAAVNATSVIQPGFNDLNQEDPSRYVTLDSCDFIVDLKLRNQAEEPFDALPQWQVLYRSEFLDASLSPVLTRAFWAPTFARRNTFGEYQLLGRVAPAVRDGDGDGDGDEGAARGGSSSRRRRRRRRRQDDDEDDDEFVTVSPDATVSQ